MTRNGFAATGILVVSALLLAGCGGGSDTSITKAPVGFGAVTEVVEAPASVTPKSEITVSAAASGTVGRLMISDGQQVTAGQPLLRINSPDAQAQLAQAKQADAQAAASAGSSSGSVSTIDFTRTEAQADNTANKAFDNAQTTAEQIADPTIKQEVLAQIAVARTDYATASSDVRSTIANFNNGIASASDVLGSLSQAQRAQTQAAVAIAQKTVNALTVTSPISGTVSLRSGTGGSGGASSLDVSSLLSQLGGLGSAASSLTGALGAAGTGSGGSSSTSDTVISTGTPVTSGAPLLVITDASQLSLTAQVDETSILEVAKGDAATVQLDAVPDATYQASVISIDSQAQQSSRGGVSYRVRMTLGAGKLGDGSPAPTPMPGMSAVADLQVASVSHVLAVPSAAIVHVGDQDTVWLISSGVAHRQVVRLGAQGDTVVQVSSGLSQGQLIVTSGADKVHDGQKF